VKHVLHPHDKNIVEDLFSSWSTNYQLEEKKILKTIRDVIHTYANRGNVIILGQGGVAITKDINQSLHVKIIAPLDWRAEQLSDKMGISFNEARKRAAEYDHRRTLCIDHFMGRATDYSIFDLILNASTLSNTEIVMEILNMLELRSMIKVAH
jgi:cytidylate kinase